MFTGAGRWAVGIVAIGLGSICIASACSTAPGSGVGSTGVGWGGQVLDEYDIPVTHANIYLLNLNAPPHNAERLIAQTNSNGQWQFARPSALKTSEALVVEHGDYGPTVISFDFKLAKSLTDRSLRFSLHKGVEIHGRALGAHGEPVSAGIGYLFVPVPTDYIETYWPIKVSTRSDGTFNLRVPTAGDYDVSFFAAGYQPTTLKVRATSQSEPIKVSMAPYHRLLGQVVDSMDDPIANCTVEILPKEDEFWESVELFVTEDGCATDAGGETWERRTNSEGEFEWNKLKSREYVVAVSHPDYESRKFQLPTSESRHVIVLSGKKDGQVSSLTPK